MGSKKSKRKPLKPFESPNSNDTTANIAHQMQLSLAWKDLTSNQKVLYLAMKDQQYAQKTRNRPVQVDKSIEQEVFAFNTKLFVEIYALYSGNNKAGFYRDRDALIMHGFIDLFHNGKTEQERNAYRYSNRWITWNKNDIPPAKVMTDALKNRYYPP